LPDILESKRSDSILLNFFTFSAYSGLLIFGITKSSKYLHVFIQSGEAIIHVSNHIDVSIAFPHASLNCNNSFIQHVIDGLIRSLNSVTRTDLLDMFRICVTGCAHHKREDTYQMLWATEVNVGRATMMARTQLTHHRMIRARSEYAFFISMIPSMHPNSHMALAASAALIIWRERLCQALITAA